jgi:hypothetical protein
MKAYLFLLCTLFTFFSSQAQTQEPSKIILTPQDSAAILERAGLKVMFLEVSMNYLADPFGRSKEVIEKNAYAPDFSERVFLDRNVLVENDLHPAKINSAPRPEFITAQEYLKQFQEIYTTQDPKSIKFRVSKIRHLGRTPKGLVAEVFFESTFGGTFLPDSTLPFQKTYRLATLEVTKVASKWEAYIKEIKFASDRHIEYYIPKEYLEHKEELKKLKMEEGG